MAKPKTDTETLTDGEAVSNSPTRVFFDYRGKSGPEQEFEHEGQLAIARPGGGDPLTIAPGLNIRDASDFAAFAETPSLKRRLADDHIKLTDEGLRGYESPAAWRSLIERTESADALEHLQRIELAKPQSGAIRERRNPVIVELLEKRLAKATRRPVLHLAGLYQRATDLTRAVTTQAAAG